MGYGLYITRGHYTIPAGGGISLDEWRRVADAHPGLKINELHPVDENPEYMLENDFDYVYMYHDNYYKHIRLFGIVSRSDPGFIGVLDLAARLEAVVQGDEGECYILGDSGVEAIPGLPRNGPEDDDPAAPDPP